MNNQNRIDEVSIYYDNAKQLEVFIKVLFWLSVGFSVAMIFLDTFRIEFQDRLRVTFMMVVITYFIGNLFLTLYFIPLAERKRRKQLLSDAFGTPLTQEITAQYYNNKFEPGIIKLGANVMENALFSKEVAQKMLVHVRSINSIYLLLWLFFVLARETDLELVLWITQLVFSSAMIFRWISLEMLRYRHDQTYELLYNTYLARNEDSKKFIPTILDAYASYEAAKAAAAVVLSSKIFKKINPELTLKWNQIRSTLRMDD